MFPQADTGVLSRCGVTLGQECPPHPQMKTPSDGLNPGSGAPGQGYPQDYAPPSFLS